MTKIAVASNDGVSISQHFGRSACFIVFEVSNGRVESRTVRNNTHTAFAKGTCHESSHAHEPHSHSAIVEALCDCEAVLCYGIGWRASQDLIAKGIKPFILGAECSPEEAVKLFIEGKLSSDERRSCHCHE